MRRFARKEGVERVIEQVASPIRDSKNEIAGVVLVFRDITERQKTEDERRKAETLEQLGLLAGGIAHDFNNLLTAIIGNISLASLLLPPNDEMAMRLNDAKNASLRARDLAQQLLTFARGGAPIKKTASIGKLIQDTVSFSLRGSHSRSEFHFGADLWPAEIDPGQISQVIANLVVNADQAMPNGGTLRVSCDNFTYDGQTEPTVSDLSPGDYIRISIKDEGTGISEHYLKRIFDPYFTTKSHGNGLGLATTYSIIKNHNGLITVESQIHVGSTFTIYLPALKDQELPSELPSLTPAPMTRDGVGGGRILIVDDEEAIRALVEFTLTRLGYQVAQAENAQEGVNLYREKLEAGERFDAVILDLTLPGGMGGKEALKKLIEIDPTVNAIVSSGYATDATMSRYQDFGFRGVIAKPYEASELGTHRARRDHSESGRFRAGLSDAAGRLRLTSADLLHKAQAGSNVTKRFVEFVRVLARESTSENNTTDLLLREIIFGETNELAAESAPAQIRTHDERDDSAVAIVVLVTGAIGDADHSENIVSFGWRQRSQRSRRARSFRIRPAISSAEVG